MWGSPLLEDKASRYLANGATSSSLGNPIKTMAKRSIDSLAKGNFSILYFFELSWELRKQKGGENTRYLGWGSVLTPRTSSTRLLNATFRDSEVGSSLYNEVWTLARIFNEMNARDLITADAVVFFNCSLSFVRMAVDILFHIPALK